MGLYDLSKKVDQDRLKGALLRAVEKGALVEFKQKAKGTQKQNGYFHLICSYFALQYGERMEYVKTEIVKKLVCTDVFSTEYVNEKTGEVRDALRSWADLDRSEKSLVIDRFLDWSSKEANIRLPSPDDLSYLAEVKVEIDRNKKYI